VRREAVAMIVAVLVVVSLAVGYSAGGSARPPETVTSTTTSTTTLTSRQTVTSTVTVTSPASIVSSPQGIRLAADINATAIGTGHNLSLAISLTNTATETNSISSADDWPFAGLPAFVSPPCFFFSPLEFVVLQGHYTEGNLSTSGAGGIVPYECAEAVSVDHIIFQPNSSTFNMTGIYDVTGSNETLGPYQAGINLTVSGYWDPFTSSEMQNSSFDVQFQQYFTYPAVSPVPEHAFTRGVYTVAVADEWGDLTFDYFTVS
jgi:hypothetical protein